MTNGQRSSRPPSDFERYAVTALLLLLLFACYLIVRPFLIAFLWGWIIAISTRGLYGKCVGLLRGRRKLAAALTTILLVAILLVPVAFLGASVADSVPKLIDWVSGIVAGGMKEPPSWVAGIPLVGKRASEWWAAMAADPEKLRVQLRPYFGPIKDFLLAAAASIGIGVLQFALSLFLAAMLYVQGDSFAAVMGNVASRHAADFVPSHARVVRARVPRAFRGMSGTAAAQAILAIIGFWIAGVPNVLLLGMATFFLSIIPGGPTLLWLPAAIWLGAKGSSGRAIFLGLWGLFIVGGSD